jgi:magnesium chelatase family protein
MNPFPCGYLGDPSSRCRCTADQIARYRGRISGPLMDQIDMRIEAPRLAPEELSGRPDLSTETTPNTKRSMAVTALTQEA